MELLQRVVKGSSLKFAVPPKMPERKLSSLIDNLREQHIAAVLRCEPILDSPATRELLCAFT